jgi:hypothetical protein
MRAPAHQRQVPGLLTDIAPDLQPPHFGAALLADAAIFLLLLAGFGSELLTRPPVS